MTNVLNLKVHAFQSMEKIASNLNEKIAGLNVQAIFYNRTSLLTGNFEIIVEEPQVVEIEKIVEKLIEVPVEVEKEIIKEVPLKIVNQIKKQRGATSQYRGVCKKGSKWYAMIQVDGIKHWCGSYFHETDAAEAYDKKAFELLGDRAILNFPQNFEKVAK